MIVNLPKMVVKKLDIRPKTSEYFFFKRASWSEPFSTPSLVKSFLLKTILFQIKQLNKITI